MVIHWIFFIKIQVSTKEFRRTWPSPFVCSKTKGVSFFSTSSMPNNMCSTNRERENIRFHPALKTKTHKEITIQFNTAKVVSKDNLKASAHTTVLLGPFEYSQLFTENYYICIAFFQKLTGLYRQSPCSSLHSISHCPLSRSTQWEPGVFWPV